MKKTVKFIALASRFVHHAGEGLDFGAILTGMLSTYYKLDKTAIDNIIAHGRILKDGETTDDVATPEAILKTLNELDKTRVKTLKEAAEKDKYQEGYKKAKGEVLTETETALKAKYGVTSDLKGEELYDHIIQTKLKEAGATSEDEIKKSPTYQALEARLKKEVGEAVKAGETKYKELESSIKKEGTLGNVKKAARTLLDGLNPVLPKNETLAATYLSDFENDLSGYEYEEKDNKIFVSKNGKLLEDDHGNTLTFEEHVKKISSRRFEFANNNGGENSGNDKDKDKGKGDKTQAAYPAGIKKPKTNEELSEIMNNDKLKPEEKRVVMDTFRKENATL